MRRLPISLGVFVFSVGGCLAIFLFLFALGSLRYGSPEDFVLVLRSKLTVYSSHPNLLPPPLLDSSGELAAEALSASGPAVMGAEPTVVVSGMRIAADTDARPSLTPPFATLSETPSPSSSPAFRDAQPSVLLTGLTHLWQTWNNCGPATLAMDLSYFGSKLTQAEIGRALKGNKDDKNVSPDELADYARSQGFHALVRYNGTLDRMKLFLSNGLPVLIETWLEEEPNNGMGHYRLLIGYNDAKGQWYVYDSFVGKDVDPKMGIRIPTSELDSLWAVFNRAYVLIYQEPQDTLVRGIMGDEYDESFMWSKALVDAQTTVRARPSDAFAWFNLGTDLVRLGRYEEAVAAYNKARTIGLPWRMLWYQFGPFKAYYETKRYNELISLADATIRTKGNVEEIFYWKGMALAGKGDQAGAVENWKRAIEINPHYSDALAALDQAQ